ncbi:hypothetical protein BKA60DRAFT_65182 [Fusarium oxysporum]|nr:hypothetical protein BKA60DRAFT_65182 [Fusarium oxysporum]
MFIVVEPKEPDCLFQSAEKENICLSERSPRTLMAGLACPGPSLFNGAQSSRYYLNVSVRIASALLGLVLAAFLMLTASSLS